MKIKQVILWLPPDNLSTVLFKLLEVGIRYVLMKRKHKREIDALQREIQECHRWIFLFGSLALFFFALLLASRKTA